MGELGKLIVAKGFEKLTKVQWIAQSGHTVCSQLGSFLIHFKQFPQTAEFESFEEQISKIVSAKNFTGGQIWFCSRLVLLLPALASSSSLLHSWLAFKIGSDPSSRHAVQTICQHLCLKKKFSFKWKLFMCRVGARYCLGQPIRQFWNKTGLAGGRWIILTRGT